MNTVASFNTSVRQMTEMSEWPKYLSKENRCAVLCEIDSLF